MAGFVPTMTPQNQSGFNRPKTYGEDLETKTEAKPTTDTSQQIKADMNNTWNNFLRVPDNAPISITRMETSGSTVNDKPLDGYKVDDSTPIISEEKKVHSFEEIFQNFAREEQQKETEAKAGRVMEGSIIFGSKTKAEEVAAGPVVERDLKSSILDKPDKKEPVSIKKSLMGSAENIAERTTQFAKRSWKEGKEVFGAVTDLWKNFIYIKEKKPDPNAKANAEKLAKRKANKARFIGMLKEGMALYQAAIRKALIELEVKLGVNVLRTEDKNRLLGRNRNASFEGNDSIYAITQTAYAMMEQKKRAQEAQKPAAAVRGKPSRGQIFTDKNLSGERSGGNNMMSAVG